MEGYVVNFGPEEYLKSRPDLVRQIARHDLKLESLSSRLNTAGVIDYSKIRVQSSYSSERIETLAIQIAEFSSFCEEEKKKLYALDQAFYKAINKMSVSAQLYFYYTVFLGKPRCVALKQLSKSKQAFLDETEEFKTNFLKLAYKGDTL